MNFSNVYFTKYFLFIYQWEGKSAFDKIKGSLVNIVGISTLSTLKEKVCHAILRLMIREKTFIIFPINPLLLTVYCNYVNLKGVFAKNKRGICLRRKIIAFDRY